MRPKLLSIVVPVYDEVQSLPYLESRISKIMLEMKQDYELILIDDGSTDGTYKKMLQLKKLNRHICIIKFRKNFGQTAAMDAGFKLAKGEVIVSLDADLQNDPRDIPRLLDALDKGYDVVSGWRADRKDPFGKKVFSIFANKYRKWLTGERIHDSGCTLKAYRKECFDDLDLTGEMHRFIPALLMWKGFRIGEIRVKHHARKLGRTKYNVTRLFKGFFDILVVVFWQKWSTKPIYFFGLIGVMIEMLGILLGAYLFYLRFVLKSGIGNRPLFTLDILLIILGVQFIIFGLLADIMFKNYYKGTPSYNIQKIL
ncbi:glycosyltransferase family 2 protein [Candidatus Woesearchaeota archaeon]|nr:glycosyltransferase family 2 protein [Candidatus Woesearchaeota archaeon]